MRAELLPVLLGILVAAVGVALLADARLPDAAGSRRERRRRVRAERSRPGEAVVGLGTLCLAAALMGRDGWRYGTLVVIGGTALLAAGAVMNRHYLRELFLFRGPARRAEGADTPPETGELPREPQRGRMRIR